MGIQTFRAIKFKVPFYGYDHFFGNVNYSLAIQRAEEQIEQDVLIECP